MSDTRQNIASAAAVAAAEKARPNWRVVPVAQAATAATVQADATTPEMSTIARKYFGDAVRANIAPAAVNSELVVMEPIDDPARVGRKVVIVQNGQITGEQG